MAQNFIACDRQQQYLMPPSIAEWLPEGHLAWFVCDAVSQMDLAPFYGRYRAHGWGRAAYEPSMRLGKLAYRRSRGGKGSRPGGTVSEARIWPW